MPNMKREKLQKLEKKRQWLIDEIFKENSSDDEFQNIERNYNQKIRQIKAQMANLNKLDDSEKNIHAIWIGNPPEDEFNYLKLWSRYNPEYKIHIWTDYTHILSYLLDSTIASNAKIINDDVEENDYQLEAELKDHFYNNYQLKNRTKTFDENVKDFLFYNDIKSDFVDEYIAEAKAKFLQIQNDIKKYTSNEVFLHDVNEEKDSIFSSKKYYDGYLETLEHLHLCAGASDRLRYAVLDKFGGVYLDTDIAMKFNLEDVQNNQEMIKLINQIEWSGDTEAVKTEIILNHMILLNNLDQLNDEQLRHFAKKWDQIFFGSFNKNFSIFKAIGEKFKNMNLNLTPELKLDNLPIDNAQEIIFHSTKEKDCSNAFLVSKKDSNFLQDLMKGIEITDEKLNRINMNTYTKLVNKGPMILYHTGPTSISTTMLNKDQNYFYDNPLIASKIINLENINSYNSSWYDESPHKDMIKDQQQLKIFFYSNADEVVDSDKLKKYYENRFYEHEEETMPLINDFEEEISIF